MNKEEVRPAQKWRASQNSAKAKEESKHLFLPQKDLTLPPKRLNLAIETGCEYDSETVT